jgi:drug/metabolite transporter (DMT)-like permease
MDSPPPGGRTLALTALALVAFAANSLLCRMALQPPAIDAATFASVRVVSGALALALVLHVQASPRSAPHADWLAAILLFAYVALFSFAYLTLSAGTGALILFGAVQVTMFGAGLRAREPFAPVAWLGLALAAAGLVGLVLPGLSAPPLSGALLMGAAGVAWGGYTLRGRTASHPLAATAGNFLRAALPALVLSLLLARRAHASVTGLACAVLSGALTSGLGYVIWYAALAHMSSLRAATVQLAVPPLAAFAGVLVLAEPVTTRLVIASTAILGGIALVLVTRGRH